MAVVNNLGSARLRMLAANRPTKNNFLTPLIASSVPRSLIKSTNGVIPVLDAVSTHPQTGEVSKVGQGADAHNHVPQFSDRTYACDRYAEMRGYEDDLNLEELSQFVKDEYMPGIEGQIQFDVDSKLYTILTGAGVSANSRDVTKVKPGGSTATAGYGGEAWDATASDMLGDLEKAVDATGADFMYISTDIARIFARNSQFHSVLAANASGVIPTSTLAQRLQDHLQVSTVQIGRTLYHDGNETQALDLTYSPSNACYVGRKSNLLFVDYSGGINWKEHKDDPKSMTFVQGDHTSDIVIVDPAMSIAFDEPTVAEA